MEANQKPKPKSWFQKSYRSNLSILETRLVPMNDCIVSRSPYASSSWSFRPQDSRRSLSSCFCCFSRDRCSCSSVSMRWKSSGCMGLLGWPLRVLVTSDVAKNIIIIIIGQNSFPWVGYHYCPPCKPLEVGP